MAFENPKCTSSVIDGGFLLYQTSWASCRTYKDVTDGYLKYVQSNYLHKKVWVVFDGYNHKDSTKSDTHLRRSDGKRSS